MKKLIRKEVRISSKVGMMSRFFLLLLLTLFSFPALAREVHYELTATKGRVNLSGKKEVNFAIMMNGSIPAPTLEFTEGDEAVIKVTNNVPDDEVSVHWHGLLLPSLMDGVPYVSTPPIRPGESFTYRFKLRQSGTYWYHSHTGVQEQKGLFGAFIIHPKNETVKADKEVVLIVSDWTDENANDVLKNLRKDGDYYLYKKGTMRSWSGAIREGSFRNFLYNEWTRMGGMDYSDVGYDAFLINGKKNETAFAAKSGETIRLRVINAAASTYFYYSLAGLPMEVISADGKDIMPVKTKEILSGMAETHDILFTLPHEMNFEFRATAQDGTGSTSAWIGSGEKMPAEDRVKPDLYARMDHSAHAGHAGHSMHSGHEHGTHETVLPLLTVDQMMSEEKTVIPTEGKKVHEVKLVLNGDMRRYVWYINNKAIHEDRTLRINEGDIIRYTFVNETMMHHPMHLHGHFFRVMNEHGDYAPLKHTVDVPPHMTRTIEFLANEPGDWMLHCHNLYHMKTGMGRVVEYSSFKRDAVMDKYQKLDPHLHDHLYYRGMLEAATNHAQAKFNLMRTRDELELRTELREDFGWKGEGDLFYKRWLNRWTHVFAGGTMVTGESAVVAGVGYILPMLFETHLMLDQKARMRLDLNKRFQWTKYIYSDTEFTFRQKQASEFEVSLMYQKNWAWSAGLMFTEHSLGAGAQYNF